LRRGERLHKSGGRPDGKRKGIKRSRSERTSGGGDVTTYFGGKRKPPRDRQGRFKRNPGSNAISKNIGPMRKN